MTENWVLPLILSKTGLEFDLVGSNFWPEPWSGRVFHTGGQIAGSLAVVTDAAHVLVDLTSFLISLFSLWLTSKPPTKQLTFGWHRAGRKHVIVWICGMGEGSYQSQGLENMLMSNTGLQALRDSALMLPQLSGHKTEKDSDFQRVVS